MTEITEEQIDELLKTLHVYENHDYAVIRCNDFEPDTNEGVYPISEYNLGKVLEKIHQALETRKRCEQLLEYMAHVDDDKISPIDSTVLHAMGKTLMHILVDEKFELDQSRLEGIKK